jgi:hypothetical protein
MRNPAEAGSKHAKDSSPYDQDMVNDQKSQTAQHLTLMASRRHRPVTSVAQAQATTWAMQGLGAKYGNPAGAAMFSLTPNPTAGPERANIAEPAAAVNGRVVHRVRLMEESLRSDAMLEMGVRCSVGS